VTEVLICLAVLFLCVLAIVLDLRARRRR